MRIAVIGAFGQLGSDLMPVLGERGILLGHHDIELAEPDSIAAALGARQPTHVINCAAYNLVDKAEDEPEVAFRVNGFGTRNLAKWCASQKIPLLHVSTDYVFGLEQSDHPWMETDPTGPASVYGTSKLAGEIFVRSLCPQHLIVRTCGLYGHRAARGKGNFVETMLRLGRERPELKIVADQYCTPTSTADLAVALVQLIECDKWGVYHATNAGQCSWYEFACEIFRLANLPVKAIPIPAAEYALKARRPDYSVLDCSKLQSVLGEAQPSWQDALARYLRDRIAAS
ncbi:MAG: rmlD [Schlesneria sp.]|nr:rmlD [Schlesneria sp.]